MSIFKVSSGFDYVDGDGESTGTGTGTGTGATVYQAKIQRVEIRDDFYMLLRDREQSTYWVRNLRTNEEAYTIDNPTHANESDFWNARTDLVYSTRNTGRR